MREITNLKSKSDDVVNIGSRLELMVDGALIESMTGGAELRLHRPVEREVVFICDQPWEGNWSGSLTVVGERSERNWGSEGPPTSEGFKYMPRLQSIRWRPVD